MKRPILADRYPSAVGTVDAVAISDISVGAVGKRGKMQRYISMPSGKHNGAVGWKGVDVAFICIDGSDRQTRHRCVAEAPRVDNQYSSPHAECDTESVKQLRRSLGKYEFTSGISRIICGLMLPRGCIS